MIWYHYHLNIPLILHHSTARTEVIMTVLLKNLFTVHIQFDLIKLETHNTRDDKV